MDGLGLAKEPIAIAVEVTEQGAEILFGSGAGRLAQRPAVPCDVQPDQHRPRRGQEKNVLTLVGVRLRTALRRRLPSKGRRQRQSQRRDYDSNADRHVQPPHPKSEIRTKSNTNTEPPSPV